MKLSIVLLCALIGLLGSRSSFASKARSAALGNAPLSQTQAVGLKLTHIESGGIYDKIGLQVGDVVKKINDSPVLGESEMNKLFEAALQSKKIKILIEREGQEEILRYTIK